MPMYLLAVWPSTAIPHPLEPRLFSKVMPGGSGRDSQRRHGRRPAIRKRCLSFFVPALSWAWGRVGACKTVRPGKSPLPPAPSDADAAPRATI